MHRHYWKRWEANPGAALPDTVLTLSHWPKSGTPRALKADTSTGIVFNYLVANGDAHLKNFSLYQSQEFGDYTLTPAYDLICTKLHLPHESRLALNLLADGEYPTGVTTHGFVTGADFLDLASRLGINAKRAAETLDELTSHRDEVATLIDRSFLSDEAKTLYSEILDDRRQALAIRE